MTTMECTVVPHRGECPRPRESAMPPAPRLAAACAALTGVRQLHLGFYPAADHVAWLEVLPQLIVQTLVLHMP